MQLVLLYNLDKKKSINIKMICHKLNVTFKNVEKDEYSYRLDYISGLSDNNESKSGNDFTDEMLVFVNLSESTLNKMLKLLRQKHSAVSLKAVLTDTNKSFTSYELFKEISSEHIAMNNGKSIHN